MEFKQFVANIFYRFKYFCSNTSLNGFCYIANNTLFLFDHILWTTIIILQIYFCYQYSIMIFQRINSHPVLEAFDTKDTFAHEVILSFF